MTKLLKILGLLYQILRYGHDLGLYARNGNPISNIDGLYDHLKSIK